MAIMACRMGQGRGCCWIPNWDPYKPIDVHCIYVLCKCVYIYTCIVIYIYVTIYIYTPNHHENRMGYSGTYTVNNIIYYHISKKFRICTMGKNSVKPVDLKLPIFSKIHLQNACAYSVCIDTVCHIHIHTYVHIIYIYIYIHIHTHLYSHIHAYTYICHIRSYIYIYHIIHMYINIYIYT
jgi:hypothetical protein